MSAILPQPHIEQVDSGWVVKIGDTIAAHRPTEFQAKITAAYFRRLLAEQDEPKERELPQCGKRGGCCHAPPCQPMLD